MKQTSKLSTLRNRLLSIMFISLLSGCYIQTDNDITTVTVEIPETPASIDPMIYGQMLEDCNDRIIYDGIANFDGSVRQHVTDLLIPLEMPIVRWPGGTFVHEYRWENGIGPLDDRPTVSIESWGGIENYRFGTDEFLQWCEDVGTEPYINFNMSNHPEKGGTLAEALKWIEYVNGSADTKYGKKRAENGREIPYNVKYWCIGNENWGPFGVHEVETDTVYAERLYEWASAIRKEHPELQLMGVGFVSTWDQTVLSKAGHLIDWLTQHYYVRTQIKNNQVQNPQNTLFAPDKMEKHLEFIGAILSKYNEDNQRSNNPIRFSIDEWNNRHSIYRGEDAVESILAEGREGYVFCRHDPRTQFDVAVVANVLNVFIRQSPVVGMANYIFPVNGHGLIRTIYDRDAYITPIYHVFYQYRQWMTGSKMNVNVTGSGISSSELDIFLDGDAREIELEEELLTYVDAASTLSDDGILTVSIINRSHDKAQRVKLEVPEGYVPVERWLLESSDIMRTNTPDERNAVAPVIERNIGTLKQIDIQPCGIHLIRFVSSE